MELNQQSQSQKRVTLPAFDIADVLTVVALVIIGFLLLTDRIVPEYMIALVSLGTGKQLFSSSQVQQFKSDKSDLG